MVDKNKQPEGEYEWAKHWRVFAAWYTWGSPVGLGIFLVCLGLSVWLLSNI